MKKIIIPVMMLGLTLTNCKNNSNEESELNSNLEAIDTTMSAIDTTGIIMPETEISSGTETENWDNVIAEYESFVDNYIEAMKKMKAGDMSVAADLASMQEQADSLSKKLKDAEKDLTPAQMKRFIKLQTKFSNAIVDMM